MIAGHLGLLVGLLRFEASFLSNWNSRIPFLLLLLFCYFLQFVIFTVNNRFFISLVLFTASKLDQFKMMS